MIDDRWICVNFNSCCTFHKYGRLNRRFMSVLAISNPSCPWKFRFFSLRKPDQKRKSRSSPSEEVSTSDNERFTQCCPRMIRQTVSWTTQHSKRISRRPSALRICFPRCCPLPRKSLPLTGSHNLQVHGSRLTPPPQLLPRQCWNH